MNKYRLPIALLSIFTMTALFAKKEVAPLNYTQSIDSMWLSTFDPIEDEETKNKEDQSWFNKLLYGENKELQPPKLDDRNIAELSIESASKKSDTQETILDLTSNKKIEIVRGEVNPHASLSRQISTIKDNSGHIGFLSTMHGKRAIRHMLSAPEIDFDTIVKRQKVVKTLVEKGNIRASIRKHLINGIDGEKQLLAYLLPENEVNEEIFGEHYWSWISSLNNSSAGLETGVRLNNAGNVYRAGAPYFSAIAGIAAWRNIVSHIPLIKDSELKSMGLARKESYLTSLAQATKNINTGIAEGAKFFWNEVPFTFKMAGLTIASPILALWGLGAYKAYKEVIFKRDVANYLQNNLIEIATYLESARKISELAYTHKTLRTGIPGIEKLKKDLQATQSLTRELHELIYLLKTNTFKGSASFFSLTGRVLRAHRLMQKHAKTLGNILHTMGTIDAFVGIAEKFVSTQNNDAHFCFVNVIQNDTPQLEAYGFWNPFVEKHTPILNDLSMDGQTSRIILTGPNTGGKSTCIKSLMINVILAQTFGIAAAQEFSCTPFKVARCYLNVNDNTIAGESLFYAEVKRAKELMAAVRDLNSKEFIFIIMDEIFSGTAPDQAQKISYDFLKEMCTFKNCMFINATHFPKLTELEDEGFCANYQMEAIEENNRIVCTYKIKPGISQISNAEQLVHDFGMNTIHW